MAVRFVNNFRAPLAASVDSDDTTLAFPAGYGDLFRAKLGSALGTDHVYGTVFNSGGDIEIVKITATEDDAFTVVRGVDGTTGRAWLSGDYMACRPCAASLSEAVSLPTDLARSGINIDITEIRGLETPLSVSQGGTGVTSLSALTTALGLDVGTDVMAYVAPGASGNVLTSNGTAWVSSAPDVIGVDTMAYVAPGASGNVLTSNGTAWVSTPVSAQTWQNMSSSRALNTVYQNTTGHPIKIAVSNSDGGPSLFIGSTSSPATSIPGDTNRVEVPAGWYYKAYLSGGAAIMTWYELR